MEATKPIDKAGSDRSKDSEQKPEPTKTKRRADPTQSLLRAKKKLDEATENLAAFPDLSQEARDLRGKVFQRFIEEEGGAAPRAVS